MSRSSMDDEELDDWAMSCETLFYPSFGYVLSPCARSATEILNTPSLNLAAFTFRRLRGLKRSVWFA